MYIPNLSDSLAMRLIEAFKDELPPGYDLNQAICQKVFAIFHFPTNLAECAFLVGRINDQVVANAAISAIRKIALKRSRDALTEDSHTQGADHKTKRQRTEDSGMPLQEQTMVGLIEGLRDGRYEITPHALQKLIELIHNEGLPIEISKTLLQLLAHICMTSIETSQPFQIGNLDEDLMKKIVELSRMLIGQYVAYIQTGTKELDCIITSEAIFHICKTMLRNKSSLQLDVIHCLREMLQVGNLAGFQNIGAFPVKELVEMSQQENAQDLLIAIFSCLKEYIEIHRGQYRFPYPSLVSDLQNLKLGKIVNSLEGNNSDLILAILELVIACPLIVENQPLLWILELVNHQNTSIINAAISILKEKYFEVDSLIDWGLSDDEVDDCHITYTKILLPHLTNDAIDKSAVVGLLMYFMTCGEFIGELPELPGLFIYKYLPADIWFMCLNSLGKFYNNAKEGHWFIDSKTYVTFLPLVLQIPNEYHLTRQGQVAAQKIRSHCSKSIEAQQFLLGLVLDSWEPAWQDALKFIMDPPATTSYNWIKDHKSIRLYIINRMRSKEPDEADFFKVLKFMNSTLQRDVQPMIARTLRSQGVQICRTIGCDIVVSCGNIQVKCHKVILASHSQVLHRMFLSNYKEQSTGVFEIKDEQPELVEALIEYMYGNVCSYSTVEDLINLLRVAEKFHISLLIKDAQDMLLKELCADNASEISECVFASTGQSSLTVFQSNVMLKLMSMYSDLPQEVQKYMQDEWMVFRSALLSEIELHQPD